MKHRCWVTTVAVACGYLVLGQPAESEARSDGSAAKRPFTVADSIGWTSLLPFSWIAQANRPSDVALFSPGRAHFILHTRRGELERNINIDSLLLYRTDEVVAFALARRKSAPQPVVLVSVPTIRDEESPSDLRWLNDKQIGYIAKAQNGAMQAFVVDIETGAVSQLTAHDTDVVSFTQVAEKVIYHACVSRAELPQVVQVKSFVDAMPRGEGASRCYPGGTPIEMFIATSMPGQRGERLPVPAMRLHPVLSRIWVSPTADYAVILAPAVNAPAHWAEYKVPDPQRWGFGPQWVRSDATSFDLTNRYRYLLIDLRARTVRPLFDGPSGVISFNLTPPEVFWRKDGQSLVVSNSYLPLHGVDVNERALREKYPAISEVDFVSGVVTAIAREPVPPGPLQRAELAIVSLDWSTKDDRLTVTRRRRADSSLSQQSYRRRGDRWQEDALRASAASPYPVAVELHESLNERPRVYVIRNGRQELLFDPNPQAAEFAFGAARVVRWRDANGTEWTGGLIPPLGYVPGKQYPLVVQTHGFDVSKFLLDGPSDGHGGTAFAAQVFAGAGFAVLQIEDNGSTITDNEREGGLVAEGYRAGIERLVEQGIADPSKIGLIAFSRTGYHTLHLLARCPSLLAAVSMSDSIQVGYFNYLFGVGDLTTEAGYTRLTGGAPDPSNIGEWFGRNPLYEIGHARAAVRLEEMGQGLGFWETYAMLRRAGRPVDFVVYPDGSHVLQKPGERLASQGGNVDWFRFWLQGYEDPDPQKQQQYRRWREMRESAALTAE
jgi:hypothetical protein